MPNRCPSTPPRRPRLFDPPTRAPELWLLHRWLDSWVGVGLICVGVERLDYRLSLSHIAEGEWRAQFWAHPMWASAGYGVAATPWQVVQIAAWAAVKRGEASAIEGR
jgi:hypothetical protein